MICLIAGLVFLAAEAVGQFIGARRGFDKMRVSRLVQSFLVGSCVVCPASLGRDYVIDKCYTWLKESEEVDVQKGLEFENYRDARKTWAPTLIIYGCWASFPYFLGFHAIEVYKV